jgi:hypothetical protein
MGRKQKTPTGKDRGLAKPDLFSGLFNVAASRSAQITTGIGAHLRRKSGRRQGRPTSRTAHIQTDLATVGFGDKPGGAGISFT